MSIYKKHNYNCVLEIGSMQVEENAIHSILDGFTVIRQNTVYLYTLFLPSPCGATGKHKACILYRKANLIGNNPSTEFALYLR